MVMIPQDREDPPRPFFIREANAAEAREAALRPLLDEALPRDTVVSPPPVFDADVEALAHGGRNWELAAKLQTLREVMHDTATVDLHDVGEWPQDELVDTLVACVKAAREALGIERVTEPGEAPAEVSAETLGVLP